MLISTLSCRIKRPETGDRELYKGSTYIHTFSTYGVVWKYTKIVLTHLDIKIFLESISEPQVYMYISRYEMGYSVIKSVDSEINALSHIIPPKYNCEYVNANVNIFNRYRIHCTYCSSSKNMWSLLLLFLSTSVMDNFPDSGP